MRDQKDAFSLRRRNEERVGSSSVESGAVRAQTEGHDRVVKSYEGQDRVADSYGPG